MFKKIRFTLAEVLAASITLGAATGLLSRVFREPGDIWLILIAASVLGTSGMILGNSLFAERRREGGGWTAMWTTFAGFTGGIIFSPVLFMTLIAALWFALVSAALRALKALSRH